MDESLSGMVAIVTGASRGLGRAMAKALARAGADVAVAARTVDPGNSLPGTVHETAASVTALGRRSLAVRCDITREEEVEALVRSTLEELGRVDILVNNAGVTFVAPVARMPIKRWDLVLAVNLRGTVLCSQAVLGPMMEQGGGVIVNVSSMLARRSLPGWAAYSASKAAIERFTVSLAEEVQEHNVAVNCLSPAAIVDTEGLALVTGADTGQRAGWATTEGMEAAVAYLATLGADAFTGQVVTDQELLGWRDLQAAGRPRPVGDS